MLMNIPSFIIHSRTRDAYVLYNQSASFNFVNINIVKIMNVTFIGCGKNHNPLLEFQNIAYTTVKACAFTHSEGVIIYSYQSTVKVSQSTLMKLSSKNGVIILLRSYTEFEDCIVINNRGETYGIIHVSDRSTLLINQTLVNNNTIEQGAVIQIQSGSSIVLDNASITGNRNHLGVIHVFESTVTSHGRLNISANEGTQFNVYIAQSKVLFAGDLLYSSNHGTFLMIDTEAIFYGTSIFSKGNSNVWAGALTAIHSKINFIGKASFYNNSANLGGAIGIYKTEMQVGGKLMVFNNTAYSKGGGAYLYQSDLLCQNQCIISGNLGNVSGGGIHAVGSSIIIVGTRTWRPLDLGNYSFLVARNKAERGGGLSLKSYSKMYGVWGNDHFYAVGFVNNSAGYGGAIYVDDESNPDICRSKFSPYEASTHCFLQILFNTPFECVSFVNNHATEAGSSLYGGLLDRCTVNKFSRTQNFINDSHNDLMTPVNGVKYFQAVTGTTELSLIDSYPVKVCHCIKGKPRCDKGQYDTINVMKGEEFNVTIVAVNQINKTVKASLFSYTASSEGHLGKAQYLKYIEPTCTTLAFNVYSPFNMTDSLVIYARGPCRGMGISPAIVKVFFKKCACPIGFERSEQSIFSCDCKCHHEVKTFTKECDVRTQSFLREDTFWITHTNHSEYLGYIIYPYCPYDYCQPQQPGVWINLNIPNGVDDQCAQHRTGFLCGACKSGYSLSVGSSQCMICPTQYKLLTVLLCFGVLVFGIVLVVLILALDLTVAIGTINGMVFYANIIAINSSIFLPFSKPNIVTIFISWLNLSIGFDNYCFYVGMDEYAKIWLLLIFPTYVVVLLIVIIILSGYSSKFSQLIGKRNPAATLATLILLSYTKLLQVIIKILSFAVIDYPDGSRKAVWLPDANVQFLEAKHVPLFLVAIVFVSIGVAYTMLLLTWQWLLKVPETRITRWVRNAKLNSFIDTHHVPYQAKYRYWTGLLLLARIIIYLVTAIDISGDPGIRLLTVGLTISCLLVLKAVYGESLYKKKLVDYLNTISLLNILAFTTISFYSLKDPQRQKTAACTSISISIMIFVFIVLYHAKPIIMENKFIRNRKNWIKEKTKQRKLDQTLGTVEMKLESTFTSSEICLSPTHSKKKQNQDDFYRTNDLRESLLL